MKYIKLFIVSLSCMLAACSSLDKSGPNGYHWEVDKKYVQNVERRARQGTSRVDMVWVNPPRNKVKHSEEKK